MEVRDESSFPVRGEGDVSEGRRGTGVGVGTRPVLGGLGRSRTRRVIHSHTGPCLAGSLPGLPPGKGLSRSHGQDFDLCHRGQVPKVH